MFEVESSTFDPYVLAIQSLATLQYVDFLYLFLHVSFFFSLEFLTCCVSSVALPTVLMA